MQPHLDFGEVSSNSKWRSCRHSGRFLRTFCGKGHVNLRLLQKMDFMIAKACFDHTGVLRAADGKTKFKSLRSSAEGPAGDI